MLFALQITPQMYEDEEYFSAENPSSPSRSSRGKKLGSMYISFRTPDRSHLLPTEVVWDFLKRKTGCDLVFHNKENQMRLYTTHTQLLYVSQFLLEKDVPCMVVHDALLLGVLACDRKSWGCVISSCFGEKEAECLLTVWNKTGNLVRAEMIKRDMHYLLACPEWAKDDPFVQTLLRKLTS